MPASSPLGHLEESLLVSQRSVRSHSCTITGTRMAADRRRISLPELNTMDVRHSLTDSVYSALELLGVNSSSCTIQVERPSDPKHGDWSTNAALVASRVVGRNPREMATELVEAIATKDLPHVDEMEVAGPGFINFRLSNTWLHEVLTDVVNSGTDGWGRFSTGVGKSVIVEFVSANPTGPLHAGHGRGACFGDSIARLLERCGHPVIREFYVNDRGSQMRLFGDSLAAKSAGVEVPDGGYRGTYVTDWATELPLGADPVDWGRERALADQREVLESLGIEFDSWFSERSMVESGAVDDTLADLQSAGVTYSHDGALWLRSADYGDDKDRVLVKSDGEYTYLLPDVAYHRDKFARAPQLVNVWGADHHGYVARMHAAMSALGHQPSELEVAITQMVGLQRAGKEVRLSKRTGETIELREMVEEVGTDAVRFTFLLQSVDSSQIFDLDLVASQVNENPVFYVQYAHARIQSLISRAGEAGVQREDLTEVDLSLLVHDRELELLRALYELPETISRASTERAPHRVVAWVRNFAQLFHGFYHDCRVMGDGVDPAQTQARLWLVEATRVGLVVSLGLLGVSAPTEMWREGGDDF